MHYLLTMLMLDNKLEYIYVCDNIGVSQIASGG